MRPATWRIGLASPRVCAKREDGLAMVERFLGEAAAQGVAIVCFPETYLPGYRGLDFTPPPPNQGAQEHALRQVSEIACQHKVAVIIGMEWASPAGLLNLVHVVGADGTVLGYQSKNQLAPEEEAQYVPGEVRRLFEVDDVPFGVVICHEGWRYPETVRWAVRRGARVVFHPHLAGSDQSGTVPRFWGEPTAPYFENAMIARAAENAIYFASVNYALRYQETATSVIAPDGTRLGHTPYGEEALLVVDLDLGAATGVFAQRYAPERYGE
jgi:predicted amidohydrolase